MGHGGPPFTTPMPMTTGSAIPGTTVPAPTNPCAQLLDALRYARRFLRPADHDVAYVDACIALGAASCGPAALPDGAAPRPVGTVVRVDAKGGLEVLDHRIELDPDFEEALYQLPAGTVVQLHAHPYADVALAQVRAAAEALAQWQPPALAFAGDAGRGEAGTAAA